MEIKYDQPCVLVLNVRVKWPSPGACVFICSAEVKLRVLLMHLIATEHTHENCSPLEECIRQNIKYWSYYIYSK